MSAAVNQCAVQITGRVRPDRVFRLLTLHDDGSSGLLQNQIYTAITGTRGSRDLVTVSLKHNGEFMLEDVSG